LGTNFAANTVALDAKMLQLTASNKPRDIATPTYIWGYPLVTVAGSYAYYATKGVPNLGVPSIQSTLLVNYQIPVGYNTSVQI
jgi:hypothetical protein